MTHPEYSDEELAETEAMEEAMEAEDKAEKERFRKEELAPAILAGKTYLIWTDREQKVWRFFGFFDSPAEAEQVARANGSGEYKWGPAANLDLSGIFMPATGEEP